MGLLARSGGRVSDATEAHASLLRAAEEKTATVQEVSNPGLPVQNHDDPMHGIRLPAESGIPANPDGEQPPAIGSRCAEDSASLKIHYRLDFSLLPDLLEASARRIVAEDGKVERMSDGSLLLTLSGMESADAALAGSMFARAIARQCMESWLEGAGRHTKD